MNLYQNVALASWLMPNDLITHHVLLVIEARSGPSGRTSPTWDCNRNHVSQRYGSSQLFWNKTQQLDVFFSLRRLGGALVDGWMDGGQTDGR